MAYWNLHKKFNFLVQLVSDILISKVIQLKWGVTIYTMWHCLAHTRPLAIASPTFTASPELLIVPNISKLDVKLEVMTRWQSTISILKQTPGKSLSCSERIQVKAAHCQNSWRIHLAILGILYNKHE